MPWYWIVGLAAAFSVGRMLIDKKYGDFLGTFILSGAFLAVLIFFIIPGFEREPSYDSETIQSLYQNEKYSPHSLSVSMLSLKYDVDTTIVAAIVNAYQKDAINYAANALAPIPSGSQRITQLSIRYHLPPKTTANILFDFITLCNSGLYSDIKDSLNTDDSYEGNYDR